MAFPPEIWEVFAVEWDTLRAQLRGAFQVTRDEPNMFAIGVPMKVEATEIMQDLGFAVRDVNERRLLAMLAPIAPAQKLDPVTIVQYQDRLPLGAIVIRNDVLYLRHDVLLGTLSPPALGWLVATVAHSAARLRVNLRVPVTSTFAHYADADE